MWRFAVCDHGRGWKVETSNIKIRILGGHLEDIILLKRRQYVIIMKKKILSVLLAALMLVCLAAPVMATQVPGRVPGSNVAEAVPDSAIVFDIHDVPIYAESSEFCEELGERADQVGIAPATANLVTTRGRAAFFLVMGREPGLLGNGNIPNNRFPDVPMSDWAFPTITWAANRGWIQGRADGRFHPGDLVSRQEFAIMLVRAFSTPLHSGTLPFRDNHLIADWALPYVRRAVERGWITGFADGNFGPTLTITRGDAMVMVRRAAPLSVVYDPVPRTITWDSMFGGNVGNWQRVPGYAIGPLPSTSRTFHQFAGWFNTSAVSGGTQTTLNTRMPHSNTIYWARWHNQITVQLTGQQMRYWCFAASGVAALRNRGVVVAQQTFSVAARGHYLDLPASRDETVTGLRHWSQGRSAWGTAGGIAIGSTRSELSAGRPVIVGISQHMMVIYGLNAAGTEYRVMDPAPVGRGTRRQVQTSDWISGNNWTSTIRF